MRQAAIVIALLAMSSLALAAAPSAAPSAAAFPGVAALDVQTLDVPVKTMRLYRHTWVPNPDGKTWTRLLFYQYHRAPLPCQTIAIDFSTGQTRKYVLEEKVPRGAPWRWCIGRDGKCYMGHYGSASIWIYDPATREIDFKSSEIKPAGTVCAIACGTDGKIYGSTTPKIITFQFDPETGAFRSYGAQGRRRTYLGYGYSVAADDEYVYTAAGKIPWELVACNIKTGGQKVILEGGSADHMSVTQERYGVRASRYTMKDGKRIRENYWLHRGKIIPRKNTSDKPPWDVPEVRPRPPRPQEMLDQAVPKADGKCVYWWRTLEAKAKAPDEFPPDTKPADLGWQSVAYEVDPYAVKINFVHEMPDGRILGCGTAYQDWFILDPADDSFTVLGKIPLSHYATVFAGGKIYMMGYPSTPLYEFDPARPWTPGNGNPATPAPRITTEASNPRRVAYFRPHIKTHHARAGAVGADGNIYIGAHAERSDVGGGLGWWDPKKQEAGGLRQPFQLHDIAGLCATEDRKKIVYSSRVVRNPKTDEASKAARIFIFDTEEKKLAGSFAPFPGVKNLGPIVPGKGTVIVGAVKGTPSMLYRIDVASQKVIKTTKVQAAVGGDFRLGPDGWVWCFSGKTLIRVNPDNLAVKPVGTVSGPGRIAFVGGHAYLSGKPQMRVIRDVVPKSGK